MSESTAMNRTRQQLSVYVPNESAAAIESVRRVADPVQYHLIPAHVTLCREDEIDGAGLMASIAKRLATIHIPPLALGFGAPEIFDGHGLMLNCLAGEAAFHELRKTVRGLNNIRLQKAHITLAHPRNSKVNGNVAGVAAMLPAIMSITFHTIFYIEQEADQPWRVLQQFTLRG